MFIYTRPEKVLVSANNLISAFPLTAIIPSQCLAIDHRLKTTLRYHTEMFSRPSFALFLCVVILTGFSSGKPQNSSIMPTVNTHRDQSFVVNNNCGLAKSESEMLAHKATVDSIAAKSSKGIFLLKLFQFSEVLFLSFVAGVYHLIRLFRLTIMLGEKNLQRVVLQN